MLHVWDTREAELNARADAIFARERQHAVSVAQFVDFVGKASVLFDRIQKARADQEREQEEPLATPPGTSPSDPSKRPEPSLAQEDDTHIPSGELHVIAAKDPEQEKHLVHDARGKSLRLRYPVSSDQAEFPDPELPHPPAEFKAPVAAGLDDK